MIGVTIFILYLVLIGLIIYLWQFSHHKQAFILILVLALIPRLWLINNPALGNNDEKYHALVAKNLSNQPLTPLLYKKPVLAYDINNWAGNHLWLSKPPFSLWCMAASIKLFGPHVISVRLASLLLSILSIYIIYLLAKLFYDKKTALLAMFFMAIHGTFIELSVGEISSDHVDICFNTIFLLAIYFGVKSALIKSKLDWNTIIFSVLTGILFLTKWHVAFLIFPIYTAFLIIKKNSLSSIIIKGLLVLSMQLLIVFPWLFYIYKHFPTELNAITKALISPVTNVIQGHSGPWYYYVIKLGKLFGEFVYIPIIYLCYQSIKQRSWQTLFIISWILIPIIAFSIVETKRFPYILIIAPAIFIYSSHFITQGLSIISIPYWAKRVIIVLLLALPIRFSIERIDFFTDHTSEYANEKLWKADLIHFSDMSKGKNIIIFNAKKYIEIMFYTDIIAYQHLPNKAIINQLKKDGFFCYIVENNQYVKL